MAILTTTNGNFLFKNHLLYFGNKIVNKEMMSENIRILSSFLDKIGINWGPAFGSLIGILRNSDYLPWNPVFDIYILKEDEERFKDILWSLKDEASFELIRYERRGLYFLERNGEYFKIFVLHKISSDVRHTGGSDFIHEKYLQNTLKWDFNGVLLNVPAEVDEYLTFQYGDWEEPRQTVWYKQGIVSRYYHWIKTWLIDHAPDYLYYQLILVHRKKDFNRFKKLCIKSGVPLPQNVQLANMQPRKYKRVLTVGVYDLLHKGHVELYRRAKGLGDYLIVAAQDGDFILKYKPTAKVLNSTEDRKYMIKSIRYVDEVITYTDVDKIVREIDFDVFVTGPDQCHDGFQRAIRWCEEHGKEHIILGRTSGVSSSELKEKIASKTNKK